MIAYFVSGLLLLAGVNSCYAMTINWYNATNVNIEIANRKILAPRTSNVFRLTHRYHEKSTNKTFVTATIFPEKLPAYEWKYGVSEYKQIKDPIVVLYETYALTLSAKEAHEIMEQQKLKATPAGAGAPGGPAFPEEEKKTTAELKPEELAG